MQTQVESGKTTKTEVNTISQSTVITKTISEENKSLFEFMKRNLLQEGFTMVGEEKVEPIKSFWSFIAGEKFTYTASFEKKK